MPRKLRPNGGQDQNEAPTQPKPAAQAKSAPQAAAQAKSASKAAAQAKAAASGPKPAAAAGKADPNVPNSDGKTSGSIRPHNSQSPGGVRGGARAQGMESHHVESQTRHAENTSLTQPDKTNTALLDHGTHSKISAGQRGFMALPDHDRNLGTSKGLAGAHKLMTDAGVDKTTATHATLAQAGDNFASVPTHKPGAVNAALTEGLDKNLAGIKERLPGAFQQLGKKVGTAARQGARAAALASEADRKPKTAAKAEAKAEASSGRAWGALQKVAGQVQQLASGTLLRAKQQAGIANEATVEQVVDAIGPADKGARTSGQAGGGTGGSGSGAIRTQSSGAGAARSAPARTAGTSGSSAGQTGSGVRLTLGAARDARPAPSVTRVTAPADGAARPTSFAALRGGTRSAGSSAASGAAKSTSTAGTSGASTSKSGPATSSNSAGNTGGSTAGNASGLRPGLGGGTAGA